MTGQPVFDEAPSDDTQQMKQQAQPTDQSHKPAFIDEHGRKIIPNVSFKRFKSYINGSKVTTWAWVTNNSSFEVEVEKLELLGYHNHIRRRFRAGEEREIKIYEGAVIAHDHDHHAHLYFTIHENDDLFVEEYEIEYNRESDGTYTLEEFHKTNQTRDI